jgi:hypothetical protein
MTAVAAFQAVLLDQQQQQWRGSSSWWPRLPRSQTPCFHPSAHPTLVPPSDSPPPILSGWSVGHRHMWPLSPQADRAGGRGGPPKWQWLVPCVCAGQLGCHVHRYVRPLGLMGSNLDSTAMALKHTGTCCGRTLPYATLFNSRGVALLVFRPCCFMTLLVLQSTARSTNR